MRTNRKTSSKAESANSASGFGRRIRFDAATPTAASRTVANACRNALAIADQAAAGHTWQDVIEPLAQAEEQLDRNFSVLHHMQAVTGSSEWVQAHAGVLAQVQETVSAIGQNRSLFECMQKLSAGRYSASRRRILDESLADFEHAGVALPASKRKRLRSLNMREAKLSASFERQLREATARGHVDVLNEKSLAAMPQGLRDAYRNPQGGWRFSLLDPSYQAVMLHCGDRAARRAMMQLRNARASGLGAKSRDNTPLIAQLVKMRSERASLLGYASYAEMILQRRMASHPREVFKLVRKMAVPARAAARREIARLRKFAKDELGLAKLAPWDMAFVAERLKEHECGVPEAQIRDYFGVDEVMAGLLSCIRTLFGIEMRKVRAPVWHPQVMVYELVDIRGGKKRGLLYLDLYARAGKQGGAWAHDLQKGCRLGSRVQQPACVICCNFTAQASGNARLGWQEVITLFHEAGHALHNQLADQDDYAIAGMNRVEWDAIELPSQLMENFAWRSEQMKAMSHHIVSGRSLPPAKQRLLTGERRFLSGLRTLRQLIFLSYDLVLHGEDAGRADPLKLWRQIRDKHAQWPVLSNDRTPCGFSHIFGGGYAAGYYSYLWAEVLSADAYAMFAERGASQSACGRRFRREVLGRGGSRPAAENFYALRGREPRVDALLRQLGFK